MQKKEIDQILRELDRAISPRKQFQTNFPNFIYKIRFPVFKNMDSDADIKFDYPLTVFVGQNGCGKSSVLQALYGASHGKSVGKFWFSTKLDPIREGRGKPNCFIYEYFNSDAQKKVEVIKQRVQYRKKTSGDKFKINPDYWEPTRASIEYNMVPPRVTNGTPEPGGQASVRWKVPQFNVVYLDFRSELSAFDKYFYFGKKPHNLKLYKSKQDRLRSWVNNRLSPLFNGKQKYILDKRKQKRNKKTVEQLSNIEVTIISDILGKNYSECKMVEHECFDILGYSVQFKINKLTYTEAFAGSGEMAVVRVVHSIMNAEENSLILLDEPEVSLHPGAQKKLRNFLLEQCLSKGHQIVICSHSPVFIEDLPEKAFRVFVPNKEGKFRVVHDVSRNDAFVQIGQTVPDKKQIIVEDSAAKSLVEKALRLLGPEFVQTFQVNFFPGGETSIFQDLVVSARKNEPNVYVIFDGDIYKDEWPREEDISATDIDSTIMKFCEQKPNRLHFRFDGGNDTLKQKKSEEVKRTYLRYLAKRCFFLPTQTPEELIWNASNIENKEGFESGIDIKNKNRFKDYLGKYVKDQTDSDASSVRAAIIMQILKTQFDDSHQDFQTLLEIVRTIKNI